MPTKISVVTTCMNRLEHIKKTIIKNIQLNSDYKNKEFVLIDYNSKDGLEEWIKNNCMQFISDGVLNYYKTTDPNLFHMSHAKNMGILLSKGEVVLNVDADNFIPANFLDKIDRMFSPPQNLFCRCGRRGSGEGTGGRIAMLRSKLIEMGGYDERMVGWGLEDVDLKKRYKRIGYLYLDFNENECQSISHDNNTRSANQKESIDCSSYKNRQIMLSNSRNNVIKVNQDAEWGSAIVVHNFMHRIKISSGLPSPIVEKPIVPQFSLKNKISSEPRRNPARFGILSNKKY